MTVEPIASKDTPSGFRLVCSVKDRELVVVISGNGNMEAIEVLAAYLGEVREALSRLSLSKVAFDFSKLTFMNSSCFKSFVLFIDRAKNASDPPAIRFITEPSFHWQRRSLEALRRLAMGIVSIESASTAES